jgi:ferredoxin
VAPGPGALACGDALRDSIVHLHARERAMEVATAMLTVTVNKNRCISSGDCVETAPTVFQLGDDGKSEVNNPGGAPDANILAAARSCPVKAITVVNADTGEQLFPPPKK